MSLPLQPLGRPRVGRRPPPAVGRLAVLLGLCAAPAVGCTAGAGAPEPGEPATVCATILSTNDEHGRLQPETPEFAGGREVGGVAALGAYFEEARRGSGRCPVFLFSAGDVMQGTPISNLTDGKSMIAAFNLLGYDAAAIGNHEFDWGVETLRDRMAQADFPFLGANIYLKGTDRHPEWAVPWVVLEKDGVRVGVIGAATEETPTATRPANVAHLDFRPISATLERYIPRVREEGVDFVVVLLHAGGFCEEETGCEGEAIHELGRTSRPFDYAVTGHTHSRIATTVRGVPVVQSFVNTTAFGVGRLERRPGGEADARIVEVRTAYVDSVEPDPELAALVRRYEEVVAARAEEPMATLSEPLRKVGLEYPLGNLIADAQRAATGSRVAIMNNGGIRQGLPAGTVTYGDLFKVQPFENTLVELDLKGRTLLAALEHALEEDGPHAHLSGLTVRYDPGASRGSRIVSATLEDGSELHPDSVYEVTVNDFIATGGSGFWMFRKAVEERRTGIVDLEALISHLRSLPQPVRAPSGRRWVATSG